MQHPVYPCGKHMHFQSPVGQTKAVFDNQGQNTMLCDEFWLGIFLFEIENTCVKELNRDDKNLTLLKSYLSFLHKEEVMHWDRDNLDFSHRHQCQPKVIPDVVEFWKLLCTTHSSVRTKANVSIKESSLNDVTQFRTHSFHRHDFKYSHLKFIKSLPPKAVTSFVDNP